MTKIKNSFARIAPYYSELISRFGHESKACDYGREESQKIKFRVLSEASNLTGKSVLDVGCGFCDYADYLKERFSMVTYTGLDITPEMAQAARSHHPDLEIICANILDYEPGKKFDVVHANGIFYLIEDDPWNQMKKIIERMFSLCNEALAFNSLSTWATDKEESEYYADPLETIRFCQTLSSNVVFRHDYHTRDFTIYLYKSPLKIEEILRRE